MGVRFLFSPTEVISFLICARMLQDRTETVCSLLKQLYWFRFLPCCSQHMPGTCPGKCLPITWELDRDRLGIRLLFRYDPPNSRCILPLSSLSLRMFFPPGWISIYMFCFLSCPPLKKKNNKLSGTCFMCMESRALKSCGVRPLSSLQGAWYLCPSSVGQFSEVL